MDRDRPVVDMRDVDLAIGRAWREDRRHLLDIAFRTLGDLGEAEDAVQDACARLLRANVEEIDDIGGWLVVVVSRLCFDRLRPEEAARVRGAVPRRWSVYHTRFREPFDAWLAERLDSESLARLAAKGRALGTEERFRLASAYLDAASP